MAAIQVITRASQNVYAVFNDGAATPLFYNVLTAAWETYNAANWTTTKYCLAMTEVSAGLYSVTVPAGVTSGKFVGYVRAGASPATTDTKVWSDTTIAAPADVQTIKGQAVVSTGSFSFDAQTTAQTNVSTILARLGAIAGTGVNTVLGYFRAIANKLAGLTPSDLTSGGGTFDNAEDSLEAVQDQLATAPTAESIDVLLSAEHGDGDWSASAIGPGANRVTVMWTNSVSGLPVAAAGVWVSTDSAGHNVVGGTLTTNSSGQATFLLTAGNSYYLWGESVTANSLVGVQFTAVAD